MKGVEGRTEQTRLVLIGASAGGLSTLQEILVSIPERYAVPIAIIQHRAQSSDLLCEVLQHSSRLTVSDALDKQPVGPGIFLAPAGYHLLIEADHFGLSTDPPVRFSRPSIDVAFQSAAESYGPAVAGIVLTGANEDGARGLRYIVQKGGTAIVQNPASASYPMMPRAALDAVPEARSLSPSAIGQWLALLGTTASVKSEKKVNDGSGKAR